MRLSVMAIRRAPRCQVTKAHAHCSSTITRLRKPIRKKMCTSSQAHQAARPDQFDLENAATPAPRPITASEPLSL